MGRGGLNKFCLLSYLFSFFKKLKIVLLLFTNIFQISEINLFEKIAS
jgi:hypothetical protein